MRKRDFQRLFSKYGARSIGSVLGVTPSTVRRWRTKGVPAARDREVSALETIRRQEGYEEKALREMMSQARKAGKLPTPENYSKRRDGEKTTGWESSQRIAGFVNEALLLKLRHHLETVPLARSLPNWLATVQMSVLDGDGQVYVKDRFQTDHPEADDFIVDAVQSSGLRHSRSGAINAIIGKLREKMHTGARFYVHGVSFSTYQYKTPDETKELNRQRRRASYKRTGK